MPRKSDDGRPPKGRAPFKSGDKRPFKARPPRDDNAGGSDRPRKPFGDKPFRKREDGDRPSRPYGDRPFRSRDDGDRPPRSFGNKPFRSREDGDRPSRPYGDKPFHSRDDGDRPPRSFGDKPFRKREDGDRPSRPYGDKPFRSRDDGDRPQRSFGNKPFRSREDDDRPRYKDGTRATRDRNTVPRIAGPKPDAVNKGEERIARVLARAGLCSRREAEDWIAAGRVAVNGVVLDSPAVNVTDNDKVVVDGQPLPERERTRLWLYHKPRGLVTTTHDPEGRPTIFEALPADLPRVVTIGRLDINTEGLLMLTNDGGLARVLAHPSTGWLRRYRVRAHGEVMQPTLDKLRDGIEVDGVHYGSIDATLDRVQGSNSWLTLAMREGKNREVKNVLGAVGLEVNRLIRLSFGPFQLGELPEGQVDEISTRTLREQLGKELEELAGVEFDLPVFDHDDDERRAPPPRDRERPRRDRDDDGGRERFNRDRDDGERERRPRQDELPSYGSRPRIWRDFEAAEAIGNKRPRPSFRGARRDRDEVEDSEPRPLQRASAVTDRSGRRIVVMKTQRSGQTEDGQLFREDHSERHDDRGFHGDRPRSHGDRPFRSRDDGDRPRPYGAKPFRSREDGDRPRPYGDKPFRSRDDGDRPRPYGTKPFRSRDDGERPGKSFGGKPGGGRGFGSKPAGGGFRGKPGGAGRSGGFSKGPGRGGPPKGR